MGWGSSDVHRLLLLPAGCAGVSVACAATAASDNTADVSTTTLLVRLAGPSTAVVVAGARLLDLNLTVVLSRVAGDVTCIL